MTTIIPLIDCCALLGVNSATLHRWPKHAQIQSQSHPSDARRKGLTIEQVQQLARLHKCPLLAQASLHALLASTRAAEKQPQPEIGSLTVPPTTLGAVPGSQETELLQKLIDLEVRVTILQEQANQFTLVFQQTSKLCLVPVASQDKLLINPPAPSPRPMYHPHPAELRHHSRRTPHIEYGTDGYYIGVIPQVGAFSLLPDSSEWFAWVASRSSFRFVGQQGCFLACRNLRRGKYTSGWTARRSIHGRPQTYYLGVTDRLTIACLEHMAARIQSYLDGPSADFLQMKAHDCRSEEGQS